MIFSAFSASVVTSSCAYPDHNDCSFASASSHTRSTLRRTRRSRLRATTTHAPKSLAAGRAGRGTHHRHLGCFLPRHLPSDRLNLPRSRCPVARLGRPPPGARCYFQRGNTAEWSPARRKKTRSRRATRFVRRLRPREARTPEAAPTRSPA
jgi:hypothetical protein